MPRPLAVVFLIDALGWEIVAGSRFAENLLSRRGPLGTVLGYSSAAIPSLLSGARPERHGSWSMFRLADARRPFGYLRHIPRLPHALDWRLRRLVRLVTDRRGVIQGYYELYDVPTHVLGFFDVAQHQDPYTPGGLSVPTLFDAFVERGVPYRLWTYRTPEPDNMDALVDAVSSDARVLFLYTAELDALMHRVGITHDDVHARLRGYERFLARVRDAAQSHGRDVSIYVLSDHGMTDVVRSVDVWGALERRGLKLGRDYLGFFDSTMVRLWCDESVRDAAASVVQETGSGRLLSDDELRRHGCLFPDREYGRWVLLAEPGVMVVPSFMGRAPVAAMHGYDPGDRYSVGCFLTDDSSGQPPDSILGFKDYLLDRLEERG